MSIEGQLSPFGSAPVDEVHLTRAPLIRVLAQARFPSLAKLRDETAVTSFAAHLSQEYPLLEQRHAVNLLVTPTGTSQQEAGQRIWVLQSSDEVWKITLSDNFMALETKGYSSRNNFISHFEYAISKLNEEIRPPYIERLGLRYMNRINDRQLIGARLQNMIRSEMQGGLATTRPDDVQLRHSLSDTLFIDGDYAIQVRCGILPPRAVLDMDIEPLNDVVWVLDIDSFREQRLPPSSDELVAVLRSLADRAYKMFRWVVNDDFIQHFR